MARQENSKEESSPHQDAGNTLRNRRQQVSTVQLESATRARRQKATPLRSNNATQNPEKQTAQEPRAKQDPWDKSAQKAKTRSKNGGQPGKLRARLRSLLGFLSAPLFALLAKLLSNRRLMVGLAVALTLFVGVPAVDHLVHIGRIHNGVSAAGIDLGGLTRQEAASYLEQQLSHRAAQSPVALFADDNSALMGVDTAAEPLALEAASYETQRQLFEGQRSWLIDVDSLGVSVDAEALAEQAYRVGRGLNYMPGRLASSLFGVTLPVELSFDESQLAALEDGITAALGTPMRNADIAYSDGRFKLVPSVTGYTVVGEVFVQNLNAAFLSANAGVRQFIVPMSSEPPLIADEEAQALVPIAQNAISKPVHITYVDGQEYRWELAAENLAACIGTSIQEPPNTTPYLIVQIDSDRLKQILKPAMGQLNLKNPPVDPRFMAVGNTITIVEGIKGTGVDYAALAGELNLALFEGGSGIRTFELPIAQVAPDLTVAELEAYKITEMIVSYTTEYPADQLNRVNNIHTVCDILDYTLIAPGAEWSYIASVGECTTERGFLPANAIDGVEYIEQVGGGICQVASTVFNVILEAGFPITERVAHSRYSTMYPHGRDATVSSPYPDLKFINESENWLLLTFSYTNKTVTATMWGIAPGYKVEIVAGDIYEGESYATREVENPELPAGERVVVQEGMNGFSTSITRYVYDLDGNLVRETVYPSSYSAATEIIEIGTKPT